MDFSSLGKSEKFIGVSETAAENIAGVISNTEGKDYEEVKEGVLSQGPDNLDYQQAQSNSVDKQLQGLKQAAPFLLQEEGLSEEDKLNILVDSRNKIRPDLMQDMDDVNFASTESSKYQIEQRTAVQTPLSELLEEGRAKRVNQDIKQAAYVNDILDVRNIHLSDLDDVNLAEGFGQLAGTAVPGSIQTLWIGLHNHLLPDEEITVKEGAFSGEILDKLKTLIKVQPSKEKKIEVMQQASKWFKENSFFYTGVSDLEAAFAFDELIEDELSGEDTDVTEFINSVSSAMDTLFFTGMVYGAGKAAITGLRASRFFFMPKTPIESINSTNPEAMKGVAAAAFDDFDSVKATGLTKEDVLHNSTATEGVHSQVLEDTFKQSKEIAENLAFEARTNTHTFRESDVTIAEDSARMIVNRQFPNIQNVTPTRSADGLELRVKGLVGSNTDEGFLTLREAEENADLRVSSDRRSDLQFYAKDQNGEIQPVTESLPKDIKGSYFYGIEEKISIPDAIKHSKQHKLEDNDVTRSWLPEAQGLVFDNAAKYSQRVSRWLDSVSNETAGFGGRLREVFQPFSKASLKDQNYIIRKLEGLRKEGGIFDAKWIMSQGFSEKQLRAVYAFKMTGDTLHFVANDRLYRKWFGEGVKSIEIGDKLSTAGKVLSRGDVDTSGGFRHVYNPNTGTVERLSSREVDDLYDSGSSIAVLKEYHGSPDSVSKYVVISPEDKVTNLPRLVLNYDPRYIAPKLYDYNLFIREKRSQVKDGVTHEFFTARAGAEDFKEARSIKEQLQKENPDAKYEVTFSKELLGDAAEAAEDEIRVSQGRLFFSKRGETLKGSDGYATTDDMAASMIRGIDTIARNTIRGDSIEHLQKVFINTYMPKATEYPRSVKELDLPNKAKTLHQTIEDMITIRQGKDAELWRASSLWLARALGDKDSVGVLANTLSRGAMVAADASPSHIAKALAFKLFIEGAPTRQLFIQGQQFLFMSPLAGRRFPVVLKDSVGLVAALGYRAIGRELPEGIATRLKRLDHSGFLKTVDQHSHMDGKLALGQRMREKTLPGKIIHGTATAANFPFSIGKFGFMGGESFNRLANWVLAEELFFKKNKRYPRTKREVQETNADAMQLSFAVHRDSSYSWQHGSWGAVTQFLSVQIKGLSAMTFSNKLTPLEKGRVAAGQYFLHGSQAFGLSDFVDNVMNSLNIENSEAMRSWVLGGAVDLMFYEIMNEHVNVSESMSAAGGVNSTLYNYFTAFSGQDGRHWFDTIPSLAAGSRVMDAYKDVRFIWQGHKIEDLPVNDLLEAGLTVTSGYSNYTQALMAEKYGELLTSAGSQTGIEVSDGAVQMRKLLGMRTQSEKDFYKLREMTQGFMDTQEVTDTLESDAKQMVRQYKKYVTRFLENNGAGSEQEKFSRRRELIDNIGKLNTALKYVHGEDNYQRLRTFAERLLVKEENRTFHDLVKATLGNIGEGFMYKDDADKLTTFISNTRTGLPETQRKDVELALDYMRK